MISRSLLFAGFLLATLSYAAAQSAFIPKNLGPSINSSADEVNPAITSDQKGLFFTRINHSENHAKNSSSIWFAEHTASGWSSPKRLDIFNLGKVNTVLSTTGDGQQMLICNDGMLSIAHFNQGEWSSPVSLNLKANVATLGTDGKCLTYAKGTKLFISEKQGEEWSQPGEVKGLPALNFMSLNLTQNNKVLYFTSRRKGNGLDIYKTERLSEGWDSWSEPVALDNRVNTTSSETGLHTTPEGAWGFFSSNRPGSSKADIYQVKLYEDKPFVRASGKVMNAVSKKSLRNKEAIIMVDGNPAASFTFDKTSGNYTVDLPFGKKYTIEAKVDHYTAQAYQVDATNDSEFRLAELDLEEGPLPYVLLKGKLLIKNTNKPIPASAKPGILIDGEDVDSAYVDAASGTYALKLNHGSSYYLQVSAKRFESLPEIVDLTAVDGYEEIVMDLQADAEKMAIITGHVVDKKTAKPVTDLSTVRLVVEGVSSVIVNINETTDQYELRVPLREKHVISAYIPGYCSVYETVDVSRETREIKLNRNLTVVPLERGQSVRLNNIFFQPGRTSLSPESFPELDRLVTFLNAYPDVKIEIGGHTDNQTRVSTLNMAKEVMNYLVSHGISANRVTARGYASTKTVASNETTEGRALNRRVEYTILEM